MRDAMISKYDIKLDFVDGPSNYIPFIVKNSTSPCYLKLSATDFRFEHKRTDHIIVNVTRMPTNGTVYF